MPLRQSSRLLPVVEDKKKESLKEASPTVEKKDTKEDTAVENEKESEKEKEKSPLAAQPKRRELNAILEGE